MSEFPQATSRRELRERERAAQLARGRSQPGRRGRSRRAKAVEKARPVRSGTAAATPAKRSGSRARTIGSRLFSLAAMMFAGAIVVGMSLPANAFYSTSTDGTNALATSSSKAGQSVTVSSDEKVDVGAREKIRVLSWAQVLAQKYSHGATIGGAGTGPIRWPFPYPVRISSGFGPRVAPCRGCSTYHEGVDMVPGDKAAIFSSSTGVVTVRDDGTGAYSSYGGGTYGNFVIITSTVNGHTVSFTYAHMTSGSCPLVLGQSVQVGDFIGLVGETGEATGPHLHFEVNLDGTKIDPIPWMVANAGPN
ncbi:MAG TPA: M23 family metallopeptidase [Pseudolysinimonas sp.]|nr:M23 family metallopeptidase [Pseudolysinimonas sp.]